MSEDCSKIACPVPKNAVEQYLNQYSLNQVIVTNDEFAAVINGVTYTIPAGTFSLPITTDIAFPLSYQGCQGNVSVNVPAGSTLEQIQALAKSVLSQVAAQKAQCDAAAANPKPPPYFLNQQVSVASICTDPGLNISSLPPGMPPGITQSGNSLVCAAGIVASNISQAFADQEAKQFLQTFLDQLFSTGRAKCGCTFDCTPDTGPVPPSFADGPAAAPARIQDYATCIKPIFDAVYAACSGCGGTIPSFAAWDGNLPNSTCGLGNVWYCITFTSGPHTLNIQVINDDHFWYIDIYCDDANPVWRGRKNVGSDATGKYIQMLPSDPYYSPMCATTLGCLTIENA